MQRVYVEYRLLGVPMETTETPMSLRKPTEKDEVHYNFTRGELVNWGWFMHVCFCNVFTFSPSLCFLVIYVDGSHSAPLRQYLYTMLEGTDPNQGR